MQRDPLSKSPVFGAFFLLGTALAACSSDADGESSEGTLAVEAWSTSGAVLDYTFQGPYPTTTEGEPTGDWVACEHWISPSNDANPSLVVKASMPNYGSKDGFYFRLPKVPVRRSMAVTRYYSLEFDFYAEVRLEPGNPYWFFYDPATDVRSTCSLDVVEFTDTRLKGTIDCSNLVPMASSPDDHKDIRRPLPSARMSASFDCPVHVVE